MIVVLIAIYSLAFCLIVVDVLFWIYLTQLKEYRLDRVQDFLISNEGKALIKRRLFQILFFFIFLAIILILSYLSQSRPIPAEVAVTPVFLFSLYVLVQSYKIVMRLQKKRFYYPKPTSRVLMTGVITAVLMLLVLTIWHSFLLTYFDVTLLFFQTWSFLFVLASVLLTHPAIVLLKKRLLKKAAEKRNKCKKLAVVGITGSYGKTSVKEYLYSILKDQFSVLKTAEHVNTEVGVAKTVLENLSSEHEVFIVEMGAYKKGEIKKICEIVKPSMGIITAVNEQHIALFKSMKNIVSAKAELAFAVLDKGKVILNKDNKYCRLIGSKIEEKALYYSMRQKADIELKNSEVSKKGTLFTIRYKGAILEFSTKLIGDHVVQNLLAAILAAIKLGVPYKKIQRSVAALKPVHENMEVINSKNAVYIDNTYNLNPQSIVAACKLVSQVYPKYKKVVVLDDVLELGKKSSQIHQKIGKLLAKEFDEVYLMGSNYSGIVKKSMIRAGKSPAKIHLSEPVDKMAKEIQRATGKTVVVFLGRRTKKVFNILHD